MFVGRIKGNKKTGSIVEISLAERHGRDYARESPGRKFSSPSSSRERDSLKGNIRVGDQLGKGCEAGVGAVLVVVLPGNGDCRL